MNSRNIWQSFIRHLTYPIDIAPTYLQAAHSIDVVRKLETLTLSTVFILRITSAKTVLQSLLTSRAPPTPLVSTQSPSLLTLNKEIATNVDHQGQSLTAKKQ